VDNNIPSQPWSGGDGIVHYLHVSLKPRICHRVSASVTHY
jgi:hypothetical protein